MNIMPFTCWRQSPPAGQRDGLLCRVCHVESERWGAHKGTVTSDTACECLVTSELSCMFLSQYHTMPWPVGQDYAPFSYADSGDMELLVALLFLSLSLTHTHTHTRTRTRTRCNSLHHSERIVYNMLSFTK
jgi:hypothetical protein